jgi:SAM-dependent methyltransferase
MASPSTPPPAPGGTLRTSAHGWRGLAKRTLQRLPAPVEARARRALGRPATRTVQLEALDGELEEASRLFETSEDEARRFLRGFSLAPPKDRPTDPFSAAYRDWVFALYRSVSSRSEYTTDNEHSPFDEQEALVRPYPHSTGSPTVLGEELMARGFIVKALGLAPPARLVEFGCGWGNLTLDLARLGFDVTAVEIEPRFCRLIEARGHEVAGLRVVESGMLDFTAAEPFDAALFYEAFHHCADHLAMLERLHQLVRPGGRVVFAAEPVAPMAYPWGPRLDGYSLWSTRTYGWLELGFDEDYFALALHRAGWTGTRLRDIASSPLADVIVATARPAAGSAIAGRR